ncbi:MAG TPA: GNAT family N-acetyltransferase [Acidimicrobiia bacterium]|jgi:GNAT superfamily N-acetyltransferase|nr:GNAT family N-acetyltransferase [Acidimicrobiia bacterium]
MPMEEAVRPATPGDLPAIVALAGAMRSELTPMRGGRIWAVREARRGPPAEAYGALLTDPAACVVVGTLDEVVIGFGVAAVEPLADGTRLGVVPELFVDEEARAVGVGEAMLESLVAFCVAEGCVGIDAFALPGHRAAKNFFEESGFTARAIVMHHALEP